MWTLCTAAQMFLTCFQVMLKKKTFWICPFWTVHSHIFKSSDLHDSSCIVPVVICITGYQSCVVIASSAICWNGVWGQGYPQDWLTAVRNETSCLLKGWRVDSAGKICFVFNHTAVTSRKAFENTHTQTHTPYFLSMFLKSR